MLKLNTPIESHIVDDKLIYVKREDLCSPDPGPSFSKVRGLYAHLKDRPERHIGILDTYHSKAGWGVSWICKELGKKAHVYYPKYKADTDLRENQKRCLALGASIVPIQAGRSCILYHQAKKLLSAIKGKSYMLPNGLKLVESVEGTAAEVMKYTPREFFDCAVWVVSVSSGTIAAGVLRGLWMKGATNVKLILHMGYDRSERQLLNYVEERANGTLIEPYSIAMNFTAIDIKIINEHYGYKDAAKGIQAPFPCNEYYDLKAWKWLMSNYEQFNKLKVLFWNIGA